MKAKFQKKAYLHFIDKTFTGTLHLEDESQFNGIWGEAVFNTGQTGYQESITDPSYLGQHLTFAHPHVGSYPEDERVNQSEKPHITSVICQEIIYNSFFKRFNIPVLSNIDTRALIKYLTAQNGNTTSFVSLDEKAPSEDEFMKAPIICSELERVSQTHEKIHRTGDRPIVCINYGMKRGILEDLKKLDYPLITVPYNISAQEIMNYNPAMVFLTNGPGDPSHYRQQIEVIKEILENRVPIRGICLGHQLLSLALGAETYKLPFGHRGNNHPVFEYESNKVIITSQNHGYAVDFKNFDAKNNKYDLNIYQSYSSLFDESNEGLASTNQLIRSVQHHPEANPGPLDAKDFFEEVHAYLKGETETIDEKDLHPAPNWKVKDKKIPYKRVLIIGSGPIRIGQASEFDYSGTQALKALQEQGIESILLNSNPATIMTDHQLSTKTYIEPIELETIKKIIKKEKVDAILSTMGGQTALNLSLELEDTGFLDEYGVTLLGAKKDTIEKTEDRQLFSDELEKLGYKTGVRIMVHDAEEALDVAKHQIRFPLITRKDFALGGKGSSIIHSEDELKSYLQESHDYPITLEKSLLGQKEIELEVMVDKDKNGVIVCSIENIDACGIHTGDSITVAPAQTISDRCMQQLRTMSLNIAKHMGVVAGGANVQFAINPHDEDDITVIEMNPRVSRSSALASKATGYPIAKISTYLALGYTLKEIINDITKISPVSFEPTQDYVAVKIPIFPFSKFPNSDKALNTQMKSVGEALAIGATFNEAFMKALRSLENGLEIPSLNVLADTPVELTDDYLLNRIERWEEHSLLSVMECLRKGLDTELISQKSKIDKWYIERVQEIIEVEEELRNESAISESLLQKAKHHGLTDRYIALLTDMSEEEVYRFRDNINLKPIKRAVDTCSGEFNALTPYFYTTYQTADEEQPLEDSYVILGSGPNRIGQGVEFDYSCVKACQTLSEKNHKSIMVNSNPETVSTDYDSSDRLYLSPLYSEDLYEILKMENPQGVISSFSGQTGIAVRESIEKSFRTKIKPFNFLGAPLETLYLTEDREAFSKILDEVDVDKTQAAFIRGYRELTKVISEIGLPVIIRPSYVIGGESMFIIKKFSEVDKLPKMVLKRLKNEQMEFLVENYLENAIEYDVDLIRDQQGNCVTTLCEHIEYAGVHSGDSGMITPPVVCSKEIVERLKKISIELSDRLGIIGPVNYQFAVKDNKIYCIEANPRGSRTIPFLSKAYHTPLAKCATEAILGESIENVKNETPKMYAVKQSTFPFDRFLQDHNLLGPIMKSTGETMGMDFNLHHAVMKSYMANFPNLMSKGKFLISLSSETKESLSPYMDLIKKSEFDVVATAGTGKFIKDNGGECEVVEKLGSRSYHIGDVLKEKDLRVVINTPNGKLESKTDGNFIRSFSALKGIPCFTREESIKAFLEALKNHQKDEFEPLSLQDAHY